MLVDFLAVGTFWFYSGLILLGIFMLINAFNDNIGWEIFLTVVVMALFVVSGHKGYEWFIENPLMVVVILFVYLVVGMLWSFWKWNEYIAEKIEHWKDAHHGKAMGTSELPTVGYNLESISFWVVYWPFSILAWLLDKPIKRLILAFSNVYNSINKNSLSKYNRGVNDGE